MIENNKSISMEEKKKLFKHLQEVKRHKISEKITPQKRGNQIPVSFLQELHLSGIDKELYNPDEIRLPGPDIGLTFKIKPNFNALRKSIHEIVRRHEVIRTKYKKVEGEYFQIINEVPKNAINIVDLENLSEDEKKDESNRLIKQRCWEKIDIFNAPLMIKFLLISRESEYDLVITTNHIVMDAESRMILMNELFTLYYAFSNNMPSLLPELPIQIADFSIWERKKYSNENLNEKLKYWKKELSDRLEMKMPIDKIPSNKSTVVEDEVQIKIEPELVKQIKILSNDNKVSLFTTLFAAFMSLVYCFSRYTYNELVMDISKRDQSDIGTLIGCFVDFQYIRIDLRGDPEFKELLRRTNETILDARYNYIPSIIYFEHNSSPSDIMFNYIPVQDNFLRDLKVPENSSVVPLILPSGPKISLFLFALTLYEIGDKIVGNIEYKAEVYERKTILKFVGNYIRLLVDIVKKPDIRISEMGITPHYSTLNFHGMIS